MKTQGFYIKRKIKTTDKDGKEVYRSEVYRCKANRDIPPTNKLISSEIRYYEL